MFEVMLIFWAGLHVVLGSGQILEHEAAEIRAGNVAPIVVPKEQGIPWLTEQSIARRKKWDAEHAVKP